MWCFRSYQIPALALPLDSVVSSLTGKTVQRVSGNQITVSAQTLSKITTVTVLRYE
jgi:hypothetical protein